MKIFRPLISIAMSAYLICALSCGYRPRIVAAIPRTTAISLWEALHLGIAEAARGSGLHIYWNAPSNDNDPEKQLDMLAAYERRGVCGVIFAPVDTLASRSAILRLVVNRIPVVIVDDKLGPPPGPFLSYVTTDDDIAADLAVQRLQKILKGHGSIAIIGISTTVTSGLSREASFEKALSQKAPDIHIIVRRLGDSVAAHQQQIAQDILNSSTPVDVIVALSSAATHGAFYAKLASASHPSIPIIGFDQDSLVPIQVGAVDAVVVQDTRTMGQIAMKNIQAQIRGESVPGTTKVPPILLTRETLHSQKILDLWAYTSYRWSDL